MATSTKHIVPAPPREDVRITLPNQHILSGDPGTTIEMFFEAAQEQNLLANTPPIIAAVLDDELRELSYPVYHDAALNPVRLSDSDGSRIYRRSLVLVMVVALTELWPQARVSVNYAVSDGGYFCELTNGVPLDDEDLARLDARMREIVNSDDPISKRNVDLEEARHIFQERGDKDKLRLLSYRDRDMLTLYRLRSYEDYFFGYMVPSTRYLDLFRIIGVKGGFVLQYPRSETPSTLHELKIYPRLFNIFYEADEWTSKLDVEDVGRLNDLVQTDNEQELILVAEAWHAQNIANIAESICWKHEDGVQLVLIAGPSSSGKTTFAKRLAIQLLAYGGLRPFTLEMDNYFVDRENTPRNENGDYDFEALEALKVDRFNNDLLRLMRGETVQLPRFDFKAGRGGEGRIARLHERQIIIVEGIHGLNPRLVESVPDELVFRVYVSALTQLNIDRHNRVPTTDVRLLRRIVRDARTRNWRAIDTLELWRNVRRGEKRNIFPYQENADVMFNSGLIYELAALRPLAEPLLLQVEPHTPQHLEAKRLLSFLRWVRPFSLQQTRRIPDTSLLREFIGGSVLAAYHPGDHK